MRSFALLLLLLGIVVIVIGFLKNRQTCPPPRIEYRFIPRSLLDEQLDSNTLNSLGNLFDSQDPWLGIDLTKHSLDNDGNMDFGNNNNSYNAGNNFFTTQQLS